MFSHICCKYFIWMLHILAMTFQMFSSVFILDVAYVFTHILQMFYLDVAYACNDFPSVFRRFASVSDICFKCFIWMLHK
jgi:hypothetical protein